MLTPVDTVPSVCRLIYQRVLPLKGVLENPFRRQHVLLFNPAHIEHQDETRLGFMIFGLRCT